MAAGRMSPDCHCQRSIGGVCCIVDSGTPISISTMSSQLACLGV
jgi:hypothetical protein